MKVLVFGFALLGFMVGIALGTYGIFFTSPSEGVPAALYYTLCPPSFAAIALDNASRPEAIFGWVTISAMNAGLYSIFGFAMGKLIFTEPV